MLLLPTGFFQPSVSPLLLDGIAATAAAYSVRKLRAGYVGAALRVRRDSDNAELDIGFTGDALDTVSLLAFVGGASGWVSNWYDQSGNARDAAQATPGNQFRIVGTGTLDTDGGLPILVQSAQVQTAAIPASVFAGMSSSTAVCAFKQVSGGDGGWWSIGSASATQTHTPFTDGNAYEQYLATSRFSFGPYAQPYTRSVHTAHNTGAALSVFRCGNAIGTAAAVTFTATPSTNTTACGYQLTTASRFEVIFSAAALSTADRQKVERSMGTYYAITVA